jgi:hypothetical protein
MEVTIYFSNIAIPPATLVKYVPNGAFAAQDWSFPFQPAWKMDAQGFPINANITLTPAPVQESCVPFYRLCRSSNLNNQGLIQWTGHERVIYNQGGSMTANIIIGSRKLNVTAPIQISSSDVTVTARTNSLLIGLTIALIGFAVWEVRDAGNESKYKKRNHGN